MVLKRYPRRVELKEKNFFCSPPYVEPINCPYFKPRCAYIKANFNAGYDCNLYLSPLDESVPGTICKMLRSNFISHYFETVFAWGAKPSSSLDSRKQVVFNLYVAVGMHQKIYPKIKHFNSEVHKKYLYYEEDTLTHSTIELTLFHLQKRRVF